MKTWILTVTLASIALCANAAVPPAEVEMRGSIDNHYAIAMKYQSDGKTLHGSYSYGSTGKPLQLDGTVSPSGAVHIDELDSRGVKTGAFAGHMIAGKRMFGEWTNAQQSKKMPFILGVVGNANALDQGEDGIVISQQNVKLPSRQSENGSASVSSPVVNQEFIADKATAKLMEQTLSLKKVFGQSLAEMKADIAGGNHWLSDVSYVVNYNCNFLVDCDITMSGMGAYPDSTTKHALMDTRTGRSITAADVFRADALPQVKAMVEKQMTKEYQQALKDISACAAQGGDAGVMKDMLDQGRKGDPLAVFSVSDKGITFRHDWQFPHVAVASQPAGTYFFPYSTLRQYLKPNGPLAGVAR
jgi:hypothetical protein